MNKIAFFDFCETLANFQTADAFVDYVRAHESKKSILIWKLFHTLLSKLKIIKVLSHLYPYSSVNKRVYALQLRGIKKSNLEILAKGYYDNIVRCNLIEDVINEMESLRDRGYRIVIVSGGYDLYLQYFALDFHISLKDVISTKFKFRKGKCTGTFYGKDCLFNEKVKRLNQKFNKNDFYSIAFSDSQSDIPFLDWADKGVVIRKKSNKKWSYKFEELLWEN